MSNPCREIHQITKALGTIRETRVKLIVPRGQHLHPSDARLCDLAAALGAAFAEVQLPRCADDPIAFFDGCVDEGPVALAVRPSLWQEWLSADQFPEALAGYILRRFRYVIVFDLQADAFSGSAAGELSRGQVTAVRGVSGAGCVYHVTSQSAEVCGPFVGLQFRTQAAVADRFLEGSLETVQTLVWGDDRPVFARVPAGEAEVFLLAAAPADLDTDVAGRGVSDYFSSLVPFVMFVRYVFKEACWHPTCIPSATLIVDDPPLWPRYGFVDFERLLNLMDEYEFHTTIAFIPYYWNREKPAAVRLFMQRPDRLSLCYHGNNHTADEFASRDTTVLMAEVATAVTRMDSLAARAGLRCEKVMVFPQGSFSREALHVLRSGNFAAAVNSAHAPREEYVPLRLRDVMQPSVMRYSGFPLFLRRYPSQWTPEEVAFHVLFGRPILLVEHHEAFREPRPLIDAISMIHRTAPGVRWRSVGSALQDAMLQRRAATDVWQVRLFAGTVRLSNPSDAKRRCTAEWPWASQDELEGLFIDGPHPLPSRPGPDPARPAFDLPPGAVADLSARFRVESLAVAGRQSLANSLRVHVRRRLSELRDNHLARSPVLLSAARSLYERVVRPKPTVRRRPGSGSSW
jgi:hypothetical protein